MKPCNASCPVCGKQWVLQEKTAPGERTFCHECGSLLELKRINPPSVTKINRQAVDFGI